MLFPEFGHFVLAQHKRLPVVLLTFDAIGGPIASCRDLRTMLQTSILASIR
jgi:hypothetical protein